MYKYMDMFSVVWCLFRIMTQENQSNIQVIWTNIKATQCNIQDHQTINLANWLSG